MSRFAVSRSSLAVVATAAVLACAGCGTEAGASPTVTATATETATATVVASASAAPPAAPVTGPDYGFDFFHEAFIDDTFAEASEGLHFTVLGYDECPHYAPVWSTEAGVVNAFYDPLRDAGGEISLFSFQLLRGEADSPWPRNADGVGPGSTLAELVATYPDAAVDSYEDITAGTLTRVIVEDPVSDHVIAYGITGGWGDRVDLMQWGRGNVGTQWGHLCTGL